MKTSIGWVCFTLLLGIVLGFATGRSEVSAQGVDNKSTRWLAGTVSYAQGQDAFFLFDTQTNRLAAYTVGPTRKLELMATREISWDLKPVMWGKQEPTVQEMKEAFERSRAESESRKPEGEKK